MKTTIYLVLCCLDFSNDESCQDYYKLSEEEALLSISFNLLSLARFLCNHWFFHFFCLIFKANQMMIGKNS
jgi:hypothetical protein